MPEAIGLDEKLMILETNPRVVDMSLSKDQVLFEFFRVPSVSLTTKRLRRSILENEMFNSFHMEFRRKRCNCSRLSIARICSHSHNVSKWAMAHSNSLFRAHS